MNRAEYAPTAPPGYATVGSELTETNNEPPFRVFKFLTPKKIFSAGLSLFQGERTLAPYLSGYATAWVSVAVIAVLLLAVLSLVSSSSLFLYAYSVNTNIIYII